MAMEIDESRHERGTGERDMFIRIEILRLISRRNRGDLAILESNAESSEHLASGGYGHDPICLLYTSDAADE